MNTCITCSMPLVTKAEVGLTTSDGSHCIHCTNIDGTLKTCEQIFTGGVEFFMAAVPSVTKELAEKLARKTMKSLPYWQKHHHSCLEGAAASDEEFKEAMAQL